MVNIYVKCKVCNEIMRFEKQTIYKFEEHLKEKHPKEFSQMQAIADEYYKKSDILNKKYSQKDWHKWLTTVEKTPELKKRFGKKYLTQKEVLELMKNGYELGEYEGFSKYNTCLQKGGLGCGGETKKVLRKILWTLSKKGLIKLAPEKKGDVLLTRFKLPDAV